MEPLTTIFAMLLLRSPALAAKPAETAWIDVESPAERESDYCYEWRGDFTPLGGKAPGGAPCPGD